MKLLKVLFLFSVAIQITACGGGGASSVLKSITVNVNTDAEQNQWVDMDASLAMGKMQFPAIQLPIVDPKSPTTILGELALQSTLTGENILSASVNLTAVLKRKMAQDNLLPNGTQIPVGGLTGVVGARVGGQSKVYIGTDGTQMMLGVAVAIREFDNIARFVPGINVFLPFSPGHAVNGLAGVFTGLQSGTSGLGIFLTVPNGVQMPMTTLAQASAGAAKTAMLSPIVYKPMNANSSKGSRLQNVLFDMSTHKINLTVK